MESPVPESEINDSPRHEIILTGNHSGVSAQRFDVVGNSGSLRRIWAEIAPATRGRDSLKVDFEEQTLLALFAGVRPSGGFEVGVSKVVRVDEFAEVHVSITPPAMGRNVTQAQTTPFALVLLDYPCEKVRIIQKSE